MSYYVNGEYGLRKYKTNEVTGSFREVDDDDILWRYTTLAKLLNMIQNNSQMKLFAYRSDQFDDSYEGTISEQAEATVLSNEQFWVPRQMKFNVAYNPKINPKREWGYYKNMYENQAERRKETVLEMAERMRSLTFLNCWKESKYEDSSMWRAYTSETDGIVIKSTVGDLKDSFLQADGMVYVGLVDYIDFSSGYQQDHPIAPYFSKANEFQSETEYRIAVSDYIRGHFRPEDGLESLPTSPKEHTRSILLDTSKLIDEIRIHPEAGDYLLPTVKKSLDHLGVSIDVSESALTPNFSR